MRRRCLLQLLSLSAIIVAEQCVCCSHELLASTSSVSPSMSVTERVQSFESPLSCTGTPPRIYVGPEAGFIFARHANSVGTTHFSGLAASDDAVTGTGWSAGWSAMYLFGDTRTAHHSLCIRLLYSFTSSRADHTVSTPLIFGVHSTAQEQARYERDVDYALVSVSALYNYRIAQSRFCVMAGPLFGMVTSSEQRERLSLLNNDQSVQFTANEESQRRGMQLEEGNRVAVANGDIPEVHTLQVALQGGITYKIIRGQDNLISFIMYEYPLTLVSSEGSWKVSAVRVGAQLLLGI